MVVVVAVKAACVSVLAPLPWLVLVLGLGLAECYIIMEFPPPARHQLQSSRATDFPCIVTQRRGRASTRGSVTGREWCGWCGGTSTVIRDTCHSADQPWPTAWPPAWPTARPGRNIRHHTLSVSRCGHCGQMLSGG